MRQVSQIDKGSRNAAEILQREKHAPAASLQILPTKARQAAMHITPEDTKPKGLARLNLLGEAEEEGV